MRGRIASFVVASRHTRAAMEQQAQQKDIDQLKAAQMQQA